MVFCVLIFILFFLFRSNARKGYLDESDFRHCHGKFFEIFRHPTVEDFMDIYQDTCQFFHQETKIKGGALKIITLKKMQPRISKNIPPKQMIFHLLPHVFFSQTNLVFKSNPVFIDILNCYCHNLFTFFSFHFLSSTDCDAHPVPLCVFCKSQ